MFTDLKPYPDYAKSSVSWLGGRPLHWRLPPGMAVLLPVKAKNSNLAESTVLSLSYGRIVVKPSDRMHGLVPASFDTYQVLDSGNIVVRPTDLQNDQTSIRVGIVRDHGIITSAYLGFNVVGDVAPDFAYTYLAALDALKVFYGMGSGLRQNLELADFKRLPFLLPPADEQAAILKYLGHANARVDRAIAAKRKLIALLEEQKQAVINQAVTRGLDPAVPLKDSGIPWLGSIPAHWQALALRRAWEVIDCKHLTVPYLDDGYPLASVVQAQRFFLDLSDARRTGRDHYFSLIEGARRPRKGDLIYCRNVGVGSAAVVTGDETFAMGQDVCLLRSAVQDSIFLNHFLRSRPMSIQLDRLLVGSTFRRINISQIRALVILVPPLTEQHQIVRQIESETESLDAVVKRSTREVELLREFRTRLTADVVTGQLDIRDAASRLPELDPANLVTDVGPDEDDLNADLAASLDVVDA